MEIARSREWQPVDRRQFHLWLEQQGDSALMGMAGGYTLHPVAYYLNARDGGFWALEVQREQVLLLDRQSQNLVLNAQAGWLVSFCWELKRPDAYRSVTVADCLIALESVP